MIAPSDSLHRRARYRAVRAEHAAITFLRAQQHTAARALVEIDAGIDRHGFHRRVTTLRAGQLARRLHVFDHSRLRMDVAPGSLTLIFWNDDE